MAEQFVLADPHFTQASMLSFTGKDGKALRPWGRALPGRGFKDLTAEEKADLLPEFEARAAEQDEAMVKRWNDMVPATGAKVYVLGDVAMRAKDLVILDRLHGKKKLIYGNHDIAKLKDYARYFYDVGAYRIGDGIIMSHIPIHEASLERWKANVHGHLHDGRVMQRYVPYVGSDPTQWNGLPSEERIHPRYLCVSVEHTNYTPLPFDRMHQRIAEQAK